METKKGLQALLYQVMLVTVMDLVEANEMDQGRAINWIDNHEVNLIEEEKGEYRAEIIAATVEAKEET